VKNPWLLRAALAASAVVLLAAAVPLEPIRDAETGAAVAATLRLPLAYVLFAPISDILDGVSLLSVRQHIALAITIIVAHASVRWWRQWHARTGVSRVHAELRKGGAVLVAIVALEAAAGRMPRPMAALELASRDRLAIDFHSHTNASKDARRGFTLERNRAWHRGAGFDVAFVTDHVSPSRATVAAISSFAGEGTVMLFGAERACGGSHFVILGDGLTPAGSNCGASAPGAGYWFEEDTPSPSAVTILALPDASL
jgi:hypothetical protein